MNYCTSSTVRSRVVESSERWPIRSILLNRPSNKSTARLARVLLDKTSFFACVDGARCVVGRTTADWLENKYPKLVLSGEEPKDPHREYRCVTRRARVTRIAAGPAGGHVAMTADINWKVLMSTLKPPPVSGKMRTTPYLGCNKASLRTTGVFQLVAVAGDRFPGPLTRSRASA